MEVSNGKDIIIAVCDTPTMGRKYPFLYVDPETQDPRALSEEFAAAVKWNLVDVIVTGLRAPHGLGSAAELVERFAKSSTNHGTMNSQASK